MASYGPDRPALAARLANGKTCLAVGGPGDDAGTDQDVGAGDAPERRKPMNLQDLIDLLLDEARRETPREVAIIRAVLLANGAGPGAGQEGGACTGGHTMTFDVGLLAYADAVPLAKVGYRYCLGRGEVFLQRRRDQVYRCRACQVLVLQSCPPQGGPSAPGSGDVRVSGGLGMSVLCSSSRTW